MVCYFFKFVTTNNRTTFSPIWIQIRRIKFFTTSHAFFYHTLIITFLFLLSIQWTVFAQPAGKGFVAAGEEDGSPTCFGWQLKFASGNVTDNGDGTCSIADQTGGGGVGGWTDNGTDINLTTSTDNVGIGGSSLGKLSVDGDTDEVQLLIQGNATQTNNILVVERSDGTDILTGANTGILANQNFAMASGKYLYFNNAAGDGRFSYDGTQLSWDKDFQLSGTGDVLWLGDGSNTPAIVFDQAGTQGVFDNGDVRVAGGANSNITITSTQGTNSTSRRQVLLTYSNSSSGQAIGLESNATNPGTAGGGTSGSIGLKGTGISSNSSGTQVASYGVWGGVTNSGAGTLTTAYSLFGSAPVVSAGAITNIYALGLADAMILTGSRDTVQMTVQGNATQTSNIFVIEQSDGTDIFTGANTGVKVSQPLSVTNLVSCDSIDTDSTGVLKCGVDATGAGTGDNATVNSSAVDTTANFKDTATVTWALVDGGAGGPDDVQATAIDVTCTDCLGTTEIADSNVLNAGDTMTGALTVDGSADAVQLTVQGNATQTSDILVVEKSDGTDVLTGSTSGVKVTGSTTITQELNANTYVNVGTNLIVGGNARIGTGSSSVQFSGGYTSDPCPDLKAGALFYNSTAGEFCYCDNSNVDLRIKDSITACF